ncbi:tripartite ATP-independent transporter DctM subunit [Rhodovulum steppense]|uniref:Tripartite ATP-independent transporter DctM subunit n=1 Tax=Rhodovulum steppense TaxID=540251 RepID=A0A4R1Z1I0_9RHOB|nr:tripartite ATP-independent transporter DctM subunit [Rhodovulum steppense]
MQSNPTAAAADEAGPDIARGVDAETYASNQRRPGYLLGRLLALICAGYTIFHVGVLYLYPLEPWVYRLIHVGGGLAIGFLLFSTATFGEDPGPRGLNRLRLALIAPGAAAIAAAFLQAVGFHFGIGVVDQAAARDAMVLSFGWPLLLGSIWLVGLGWFMPDRSRERLDLADVFLAVAAITVALYIIHHAPFLRLRAGTALAKQADMFAAAAGVLLILELTRRLAGLALVVIAGIFVIYAFVGPWLPGILEHRGYSATRFFTYVYTDQGILGPTTAISSTYIILFVTFAAFLQASRVGEYFVNFAFAAAGHLRGGPAKVAVFGSGLMGMINGTSAGNVVATGSLTIPLMKKVGYKPQTAGAIEAAGRSCRRSWGRAPSSCPRSRASPIPRS